MNGVLLLDAKLDTGAAPALVEQLRARRGADLTIDASRTRQIGALCAQALLAAGSDWRNAGHEIALTSMSDQVQGQFALMGIDPQTLTARESG